MRKETVAFRTSVNGYNKKDVYSYIEGLNKDITTRSEAYEKKIKALESEKNDLSSKLNVQKEENSRLKDWLAELEHDVDEKAALIDELDRAAVKISVELDALAAQYSDLAAKFERTYRSAENVNELEKKAQAYDRIVARAKEKKAEQKKATIAQPQIHKNDREDIDNILSGSAQEILEHIQEAQQRFSEAIENARIESEMLRERVNEVMNSSKEKILSQIN